MKIAVASGKGGTGKTTVSVSLARCLEQVQFLDCDVEEPNAALFLRPDIRERVDVTIAVPQIDETRCTHCRKCAEVCAFNALVILADKVLLFPELCHGCGACSFICPEGAVREQARPIGVVERGTAGPVDFVQGILNVGEPMAPPIIKQVQARWRDTGTVILDAPPGTSCPMIETVRAVDFCVLVTEPTPFGLNDLRLAVETMRALRVPFGVVVNCWGVGSDDVLTYCDREAVPLLMKIPWDRRIAEGYSRGIPAVDVLPSLRAEFVALYARIERLVQDVRHEKSEVRE